MGEYKYPWVQYILENYPEIDISAKNFKAVLGAIKSSNSVAAFELLSSLTFVEKTLKFCRDKTTDCRTNGKDITMYGM